MYKISQTQSVMYDMISFKCPEKADRPIETRSRVMFVKSW